MGSEHISGDSLQHRRPDSNSETATQSTGLRVFQALTPARSTTPSLLTSIGMSTTTRRVNPVCLLDFMIIILIVTHRSRVPSKAYFGSDHIQIAVLLHNLRVSSLALTTSRSTTPSLLTSIRMSITRMEHVNAVCRFMIIVLIVSHRS